MRSQRVWIGTAALAAAVGLAIAPTANAAPSAQGSGARAVAASWTPAAIAAAIPRDIVRADNGQWYLQGADGRLHAYGAGATGAPIVAKGKPGGGGVPIVKNAQYTLGGTVQQAAGRLYFRMHDNGVLVGYVCSGTVVTDTLQNYSLILTAGHCVYDDVNNEFATDVMFIPDQADSGTRTDRNCANDTYGCWIATKAASDMLWTTNDWPNNIPYDYAFYLVPTSGYHFGGNAAQPSLEATVGRLPIAWTSPIAAGDYTYALGYSYANDPYFMYCAQNLGTVASTFTTGSYVNWWLSSCRLSGGASGGPWLQPLPAAALTGDEAVMSVNSWGYNGRAGMAGPRLQTGHSLRPKAVYDAANALSGNEFVLLGTMVSWTI